MNKRLAILAFVIGLSIAVLFFIVLKPPPLPVVTSRFLGFTNSGARTEALFAIHDPPDANFGVYEVTRLADAGRTNPRPAGHFSWARREPSGLLTAISVIATNEPLRVVFEFQLSAGLRDVIRQQWERLKGNEVYIKSGRTFFVTNEIAPAKNKSAGN
jgi:hypothetical protein